MSSGSAGLPGTTPSDAPPASSNAEAQPEAAAAPAAPSSPDPEPEDRLALDGMLREIGATDDAGAPPRARPEAISLGELVDKAAEGSFGFLIAVLALLAIPFVGLSTPFGLAIALGGLQLLLGRRRPWLPARARARRIEMAMLDRVLGMVARRTRWVAKATRPRWPALVVPRLAGLGIVLLGLGLALPLPIPGSNMVFILPVLVYAIGLLERDGMWIAIGHLCTLIDLALVIAFGATILAVLARLASCVS